MKTKALLLACALAAGLTAPAGSQSSDVVLIRTGGTVPATLTKAPTMTTLSKSAPAERTKLKIGFTKTGTGAVVTTESLLRFQKSGAATALSKSAATGAVVTTESVLQLRKSGTATALRSLALAPGQSLVIGRTAARTLASRPALGVGMDTVVVTARRSAAAAGFAVSPLAASIQRDVFPGDLTRTTPQAADASAFAPGVALVVGPNGFPVLATAATAQSGTNPIGPNGFPQPITNGPQSGIQPINPNGFPATNVAPFAQTGLTRSGTSRDNTAPVTLPTVAGTVSAGVVVAPAGTLTAPAVSAPAAGVGTAASSPR